MKFNIFKAIDYRGETMKKYIIILLIVITAIVFNGCATKVEESTEKIDTSMFVIVEGGGIDCWRVVYDKDTKVMYTVSTCGYNGGNFTMLVNDDGTPKLYDGKSEDKQ